ncbi:hypothetical protein GBA52_015048 [Prunus armeniaca]|nr:hypothetical protein GBA52_015048 [Prunus armeniaca]
MAQWPLRSKFVCFYIFLPSCLTFPPIIKLVFAPISTCPLSPPTIFMVFKPLSPPVNWSRIKPLSWILAFPTHRIRRIEPFTYS